MRCPSCNKFVGYDTEVEPEENSSEASDTSFTASFRRVLTCADCGEELKEAEIEIECDFADKIEEADKPAYEDGETAETHQHDWDVDCTAEATTESQTTDRNGRPIRSARYMKTLYGVTAHVELTCMCGAKARFDCSDNISASNMDELT